MDMIHTTVHGSKFTSDDENLLSSFLDIAGALLTTSQLFNKAQTQLSEYGAAADLKADVAPFGKGEIPTIGALKTGDAKGRIRSMKKAQSQRNSGIMVITEDEEEEG